MSKYAARPTGREVPYGENELIVSKTDLKGRITYSNEVFQRLSGFNEMELLGQPHSIIRHPNMPRCVFKLLWDTVQAGGEIFAYVINMARNGDHYWVLAHVTPSIAPDGGIVGYHSNRRRPRPEALLAISGLYAELRAIENEKHSRKDGMHEASAHLGTLLGTQGVGYDEFVLSL